MQEAVLCLSVQGMDTEKLRRAGLAFVLSIAGALVFFLTRASDDTGQVQDLAGMAMLGGAAIGLVLLAGALMGGKPTD